MKHHTRSIKRTSHALKSLTFEGSPLGTIASLLEESKRGFDVIVERIKTIIIHFLLFSERESLAGQDYAPNPSWQKWGCQAGSVYVGGKKVRVSKPRLRRAGKEITLPVYKALTDKSRFSQELLESALCGISTRDYKTVLHDLLNDFGISKSSVSRHLVAATESELRTLKERSLKDFDAFAIFIDGYHIGGQVFIVALGIDMQGKKRVLGFWQGATENHVICQELLSELERRHLTLSEKVLFITDGGKGVIKALRERFGKKLFHQRCTIHKDRNIQGHLPKKYRKAAHIRFRNAVDCHNYADAKAELEKLEKWLEPINPSASESLKEGMEELLTVHRLEIPSLLRKSLHSTNPIESMFSQTTWMHRNIKNVKSGKNMAQRWLGTTLLQSEKQFRAVKGALSIPEVRRAIEEKLGVNDIEAA